MNGIKYLLDTNIIIGMYDTAQQFSIYFKIKKSQLLNVHLVI